MEQQKNSFGIASLILGIVSVVTGYIIVGIVAGIVAIVLSVKSKNEVGQNGLATGGLVMGIIGIVYGIPSTICLLCTCGGLCSLANSGY